MKNWNKRNKGTFTGTVLIFLFVLLSCYSSFDFKGRVLDMKQKPIEGVELKLITFNEDKSGYEESIIFTTQTDKNGEFEISHFDFVEQKNLALIVTKEGYLQDSISFRIPETKKFEEVFQNYVIMLKKEYE